MGVATSLTRALVLCGALGLGLPHCVQADQRYPLHSALSAEQHPDAAGLHGSVSVERVEGGQRLVVVQLSKLPAPERVAPGLTEFVVWLRPPSGETVKAGELKYDREHLSGSLFATTTLAAFTVQVTGESDPGARTPGGVLLTERTIVTN